MSGIVDAGANFYRNAPDHSRIPAAILLYYSSDLAVRSAQDAFS